MNWPSIPEDWAAHLTNAFNALKPLSLFSLSKPHEGSSPKTLQGSLSSLATLAQIPHGVSISTLDNPSLRLSRSSSISNVLSKGSRENLPKAPSVAEIWIQEWSGAVVTSNRPANGREGQLKEQNPRQSALSPQYPSHSIIYTEPTFVPVLEQEKMSDEDDGSEWTSQPQKTLYQKFKIPETSSKRRGSTSYTEIKESSSHTDIYSADSVRQRHGGSRQDKVKVMSHYKIENSHFRTRKDTK